MSDLSSRKPLFYQGFGTRVLFLTLRRLSRDSIGRRLANLYSNRVYRSRTFFDPSGTASVIGGEPFQIVVANNGAKTLKLVASGAETKLAAHKAAGLSRLTLSAAANTEVEWRLTYE
jgi:hypothetical protein